MAAIFGWVNLPEGQVAQLSALQLKDYLPFILFSLLLFSAVLTLFLLRKVTIILWAFILLRDIGICTINRNDITIFNLVATLLPTCAILIYAIWLRDEEYLVS